jgi:hypothetical protein
MLPRKCDGECKKDIGSFFTLKKGEEIKNVCKDCKEKLIKDGWRVEFTGK